MKSLFSKPKVLVCVLAGTERNGWLNPYLALNLLKMAQDSRFTVEIELMIDKHPVDYARNCCVVMARERKAEWCFQIDNDQSFECDPLDVLHAGLGKDVIGFPSMQANGEMQGHSEPICPNFRTLDNTERDGEFFTVGRIGTGAVAISQRVWKKIPGPWFAWTAKPGELYEPEEGEDWFFCRRVQEHGFKVWAHSRIIPHWKIVETSRTGMHIQTLRQIAKQSGIAPTSEVRWEIRDKVNQ
jgi:hypothetical protein